MNFEQDLQRHRSYLILLARMQMDRRLQGRVGASDVVQETMHEAYRHRERFRGENSAQLAAYLRQILRNNMIDAAKKHLRGKRNVDLEVSIDAMRKSSMRMDAWLSESQTSPSENMVRHEQLVALAESLQQLPPDQAEAVMLKHLDGWSLKEIANHMRRSPPAVAGLLHRGLKNLRQLMTSG